MRLEEVVKVEQFRNDSQRAIINLYYTNSVISGQFKALLKPAGLTPQQFNILRILNGQYPEPARIGLVKERMIDRNSDMTRLVERLVSKGLIERTVCEEDRRQQHVKITEKGRSMLHTIKAKVDRFENASQQLSDKELDVLNQLLDKLREVYEPEP
mgnify:CR=1 FL=1